MSPSMREFGRHGICLRIQQRQEWGLGQQDLPCSQHGRQRGQLGAVITTRTAGESGWGTTADSDTEVCNGR